MIRNVNIGKKEKNNLRQDRKNKNAVKISTDNLKLKNQKDIKKGKRQRREKIMKYVKKKRFSKKTQ